MPHLGRSLDTSGDVCTLNLVVMCVLFYFQTYIYMYIVLGIYILDIHMHVRTHTHFITWPWLTESPSIVQSLDSTSSSDFVVLRYALGLVTSQLSSLGGRVPAIYMLAGEV